MAAEKGETFPFKERLGCGLAVVFPQDGFLVEEVELLGRARHVEKDDALGLRRDGAQGRRHLAEEIPVEERSERERPKTCSGAGEEMAAGERSWGHDRLIVSCRFNKIVATSRQASSSDPDAVLTVSKAESSN